MRAVVIGAGRMGRAAAWDLARQPGVRSVTVVDRDAGRLASAEHELARLVKSPGLEDHPPPRVRAELRDVEDPTSLRQCLGDTDVVLAAADYALNERITRAAIEAKVHMCDLGGNVTVVERQLALSDAARRRGVTVIPDCGLAPGMAGLLAARGVERLGGATEVRMRVGGLPAAPRDPLGYRLVFSVRGLTNEYLEPAEILRAGTIEWVESLTGVETLSFEGLGEFEAFHTSGGASTLPRTLRSRVEDLDYKTIRYKGHCGVFSALKSLGFLEEQPVDGVTPREFTERMLEKSLGGDDSEDDLVLLRVEITGVRDARTVRVVYELITGRDPVTGHSAMARTTAYSAAAVAYMLGAGAINERGVLPGELAVPLDAFLAALGARGLEVLEREELM